MPSIPNKAFLAEAEDLLANLRNPDYPQDQFTFWYVSKSLYYFEKEGAPVGLQKVQEIVDATFDRLDQECDKKKIDYFNKAILRTAFDEYLILRDGGKIARMAIDRFHTSWEKAKPEKRESLISLAKEIIKATLMLSTVNDYETGEKFLTEMFGKAKEIDFPHVINEGCNHIKKTRDNWGNQQVSDIYGPPLLVLEGYFQLLAGKTLDLSVEELKQTTDDDRKHRLGFTVMELLAYGISWAKEDRITATEKVLPVLTERYAQGSKRFGTFLANIMKALNERSLMVDNNASIVQFMPLIDCNTLDENTSKLIGYFKSTNKNLTKDSRQAVEQAAKRVEESMALENYRMITQPENQILHRNMLDTLKNMAGLVKA